MSTESLERFCRLVEYKVRQMAPMVLHFRQTEGYPRMIVAIESGEKTHTFCYRLLGYPESDYTVRLALVADVVRILRDYDQVALATRLDVALREVPAGEHIPVLCLVVQGKEFQVFEAPAPRE